MNKAPGEISDGWVEGRRLLMDEGEGARESLQNLQEATLEKGDMT